MSHAAVIGKALCAILLCAAFSGSAQAWTHPDNSEGPDDNGSLPNSWSGHDRERAALRQIAQRLQKGDVNYTIIAEHLHAVVEAPGLSTLTPDEQHYAWLVYGGALFNSRQFEVARAPLLRASEMPQAGAADWEFRLNNDLALHDFADSARAATNLAQHWPASLAHYDVGVFARIVSETQKDPDTAALALDLRAALATAHPTTN